MTDETLTTQEKEGNKFAHAGQQSEGGCRNNKHNFDRTTTNVVARADGNTGIVMRCFDCNQYIEIAAQLNINDLIEETNSQRPPMQSQAPAQQATQDNFPTDEQILNRLIRHG